MTKLERALAHEGKPCKYVEYVTMAAAMNHRTVDGSFIVAHFCPSHYGMPDTTGCYTTTCTDCWNQEVGDFEFNPESGCTLCCTD